MFSRIAELRYMRKVSKKKDLFEIIWLSGKLNRLSTDQIEIISKLIDSELLKSYRFGLKISREHVFKERFAVLMLVNEIGNPCDIPKTYEWDQAMKLFSNSINELLKDEFAYYFNEEVKRGDKVRNKYTCHLDALKSTVMHAIYNEKIPLWVPRKN